MFYQEVPHVEYVQDSAEIARQGVESILSQNSLIESCCAIVFNNKAVIGVVPYPLYGRSQRKALEEAIKADVESAYGFDDVAISFDMDIFYQINKFNKQGDISQMEFESLIRSVKVRR